MTAHQTTVRTIAVNATTITIRGESQLEPERVGLYLFPPYAQIPIVLTQPPTLMLPAERVADGFVVTFDRFFGGQDRIYSQIVMAPLANPADATTPFGGVRYATDLSGLGAVDYAYPSARTLKGLQVRMVDDALNLGVGHAALNLNQGNIARPAPGANTITYVLDGQEFYFDESVLQAFDRELKALSDHGIMVSLILLNSRKWAGLEMAPELHAVLLHPDYDPEGFISQFNVVTPDGLAHYQAFERVSPFGMTSITAIPVGCI